MRKKIHPVNKYIIVAAMCVPLIAQSLSGSYRLLAEAVYTSPIETISNREATDITFDNRKECEEVAKGMTERVQSLTDKMIYTKFNVLCYKDGGTDQYGSVYTPGDRKTFVLQRREFQNPVGRVEETTNTDTN